MQTVRWSRFGWRCIRLTSGCLLWCKAWCIRGLLPIRLALLLYPSRMFENESEVHSKCNHPACQDPVCQTHWYNNTPPHKRFISHMYFSPSIFVPPDNLSPFLDTSPHFSSRGTSPYCPNVSWSLKLQFSSYEIMINPQAAFAAPRRGERILLRTSVFLQSYNVAMAQFMDCCKHILRYQFMTRRKLMIHLGNMFILLFLPLGYSKWKGYGTTAVID